MNYEKYKWPSWTDWCSLQKAVAKGSETLPKNPGAYVIAADKPIERCCGTDRKGILTIGQTGGELCKRAKAFYRCASDETDNEPRGHSAGYWFWSLAMAEHFRPGNLRIRWRETSNGEQARRMESEILSAYTNTYFELPPLNRSFPWKDWRSKKWFKL